MSGSKFLGFPAPLLGLESVRLPILFDNGDLLAFEKPIGVLVREDSWYPRTPVLIEAVRYQAGEGKPEFARMNIPESGLWAIHDLDPECHGPVLMARSRDTAEACKEAFGSLQFTFSFELICKTPLSESPPSCTLPVARHRTEKRILVSHATGKQTETDFEFLNRLGSHQLVRATTRYPRRHHLRLHAVESGLPLLGDALYAKSPLPLLSRFKKDYRPRKDRKEQPLYPGPAYRLASIQMDGNHVVECPAPSKWKALARQLARHDFAG